MSEMSNSVVYLTEAQAISVGINPAAYKGDVAMPNIHAGTVVVGEADSDVSVTVTGAYPDYYLNFVLPPADDGEDGADGADGIDGITPNFIIGNVVSGETASATITGTKEEPILNLVLPIPDVPYITEEAEGSIVTIEDAAAAQALSAVAMIEPVQAGEGDPYPPGGGGQLYDVSAIASTEVSVDDDGWITLTADNSTGTAVKYAGCYTPVSALLETDTDYAIVCETREISGGYLQAASAAAANPMGQFGVSVVVRTSNQTVVSVQRTRADFTGCASMLRTVAAINPGAVGTFVFRISVLADTSVTAETFVYAPYANIRPITGHEGCEMRVAGKNLLPNTATTQTVWGVTFTVHEDGSITVNGTATNNVYYFVASGKTAFPVGTYVMTGSVPNIRGAYLVDYVHTPSGEYIRAYVDNGNGVTVDVTDPTAQHGFQFYVPNGVTVTNVTIHPMLRLASDTDTTYEPYQGSTHTATFPQTVYGGSYDFVSGKLTVDRAMVTFDGTEEWKNNNLPDGTKRWWLIIDGVKPVANIKEIAPNLSSSHYPANSAGKTWEGEQGVSVEVSPNRYMMIYDSACNADMDEWKAYLAAQYAAGTPVQVCYELDEPLTYDLTPQQVDMLFGLNNVWSDTGESKVVYIADTKIYVDNAVMDLAEKVDDNSAAIAELAALVANIQSQLSGTT